MIFGIGIDVVEIGRIRGVVSRFGDRFAHRILGTRELERYRYRRAHSEERGIKYLATRFAAKEAVSKALGLGMRMPMTWKAVEIVNDPSGRPVAFVSSVELEAADAGSGRDRCGGQAAHACRPTTPHRSARRHGHPFQRKLRKPGTTAAAD